MEWEGGRRGLICHMVEGGTGTLDPRRTGAQSWPCSVCRPGPWLASDPARCPRPPAPPPGS